MMAAIHTIKIGLRCILVVTSHPLAALYLRPELKALPNCKVSFAFDRVDAFLIARQEPPDLLILDYCIADVNARNLAQAFHRLYPATEIIILTTGVNNESRQQLAESCDWIVLEKPVDSAELYQAAVAALIKPT